MRKTILILALLCALFLPFLAQAQTGTLSGKVVDQTGAVIPQATVTATAPDGKQTATTTNREGSFQIQGLAPGAYDVSAGAEGFATLQKPGVQVSSGGRQTLNLALQIQAQQENVEVQAEGTTLDVGASTNANAIVLKGKDLEALSDDPDELQNELSALAGPAAGPNGGQIYIDGFTGGQLPPKSAIREIRINQNPFSAQYDKLGYGRIEILTKPGTDQLHGQVFFNDTNAILNSGNPFVHTPKPSYNTDMFDGNLGGPINKKTSFFIDAQRRDLNDYAAIDAANPADPLNPLFLTESVHTPETRTSFSPRIDYQLTPSNTLTLRYQLTHSGEQNVGVGGLALPSTGYNLNETEHTLQITDNQILSPKVVNETRFQFQRETNHQRPVGFGPEVSVQGEFTEGQTSKGLVLTTQDNFELQNYTQMTRSNHVITFGARLRGVTASESTDANFNGSFVFSPLTNDPMTGVNAYIAARNGLCVSGTAYNKLNCPTQFSMSAGSPGVSAGWFDAGVYAEDEWRAKPNLSVTYGLRFESQNDIQDHADFAPRIGIAWGVGSTNHGTPKTVLRGGFGIFYDRFGYNLVEQANLLNGVTQQSVTIKNPDFFSTNPSSLPSFSSLLARNSALPTTYQISPNLRAPYTMQSAVSIERQITKAATLSLTYLNSRGEHSFYVDNVGYVQHQATPNSPNDVVYQYRSGGIFRQNQVIANFHINTSRRVSLFGFYMLNYANSDTSSGGGAGGFFSSGTSTMAGFISNQYNPMADYGRAAFDVRSRLFLFGSISLPQSVSLNPFVIVNSGQPYNLTTGQDNNGDSLFNDRPYFANGISDVSCTSRADFSATPTAFGEVPINYCTGPSNLSVNLRLSKTIGFGRETKGGSGGGRGMGGGRGGPGGGLGPRGLGGGGGNPFAMGGVNRRYSLTFSIFARNLFNSVNPGAPVGNLSAANFGLRNSIGSFASATANRRVDLQVRFSF